MYYIDYNSHVLVNVLIDSNEYLIKVAEELKIFLPEKSHKSKVL